jgi:hypothetical protein
MKFKKDGKVYDTPTEIYNNICAHSVCIACVLRKIEMDCSCREYTIKNPEEVARLAGFEIIEDDRPAHYTSGGIECIDAMQAAFGVEAVKDFCLCSAFKYLWRHRNKNGVEDLKKARWYLNRMIREMEVTDDDI